MAMDLVTLIAQTADAQILHVTNAWPTEANPRYGIFVQRQVESLNEIGTKGDVLFIRGFVSPVAYPTFSLRYIQRRRRPRYQIVHCHGGEVTPWATVLVGVPLVSSYLGSDLLGRRDLQGKVSRRQRVRAKILRQCSRFAANTITVSRELEDCLPAPARRSNYVIPDGVDRRQFAPGSRRDARRNLGWDPCAPIVLFAADPGVAVKRFWLAEAASREARRSIPGLLLKIASDLPPDKMPAVMNAADCLLVTSSSEGSSNVLKEALSCNLPVVSTDVGDAHSLLGEVEPSYVCSADPWELGRAVASCLDRGERSNGRLHSASFDALNVARRISMVYETAQSSYRRRAGGSVASPLQEV